MSLRVTNSLWVSQEKSQVKHLNFFTIVCFFLMCALSPVMFFPINSQYSHLRFLSCFAFIWLTKSSFINVSKLQWSQLFKTSDGVQKVFSISISARPLSSVSSVCSVALFANRESNLSFRSLIILYFSFSLLSIALQIFK